MAEDKQILTATIKDDELVCPKCLSIEHTNFYHYVDGPVIHQKFWLEKNDEGEVTLMVGPVGDPSNFSFKNPFLFCDRCKIEFDMPENLDYEMPEGWM